MQSTHQCLSVPIRGFFHRMSEALNLKPYFYGSVQRNDFFPGKSDIDVTFFSGDESMTARQLSVFLGQPLQQLRRVVWDIHGTIVHGYKAKFDDPSIDLHAEIAIYNTRHMEIVRKKQRAQFQLPFYVSVLIQSIKYLHYTLGIMPKAQYKYWKRTILARGTGDGTSTFLVW